MPETAMAGTRGGADVYKTLVPVGDIYFKEFVSDRISIVLMSQMRVGSLVKTEQTLDISWLNLSEMNV
jgi:hypothetical protein